jgi:protein HOOK3
VSLRASSLAYSGVNSVLFTRPTVTLVNKDQLDVLRELRASVDQEKSGLESDTSRLRSELQETKERNHMLVEQVNGLLLDKVSLQTQSIGHRDDALRRERNLGELRASLAGKALPKEAEDLIHALQTSHANSEAQAKSLQDKLTKARAVSTKPRRLRPSLAQLFAF